MDELRFETIEEIDEETDKFIGQYAVTYAIVLKLLQQQVDHGLNQREAQQLLRNILQRLKTLDVEAFKFVKEVFPQYYYLSLNQIDNLTLDIDGVQIVQGANHAIHKQALNKAQNDLYRDLAKRTNFMSTQAKKVIRDNSKELLTAMIESGESYRTVKRELKSRLVENGVSSFVDASRRDWTIDRYSDMLIRTKSRILHNEGTVNRLLDYQENETSYNENFDLIQISNHNAEDWCSFYEDKVYSISGRHPHYPSVETLPNRPYKTFHPNCRHVWLPYVTNLRGKGERVESKYQNVSISDLNKIEYQMKKAN